LQERQALGVDEVLNEGLVYLHGLEKDYASTERVSGFLFSWNAVAVLALVKALAERRHGLALPADASPQRLRELLAAGRFLAWAIEGNAGSPGGLTDQLKKCTVGVQVGQPGAVV
jgi:hypothetical protein